MKGAVHTSAVAAAGPLGMRLGSIICLPGNVLINDALIGSLACSLPLYPSVSSAIRMNLTS